MMLKNMTGFRALKKLWWAIEKPAPRRASHMTLRGLVIQGKRGAATLGSRPVGAGLIPNVFLIPFDLVFP
jgi:hypothetical protein